MVKMYISLLALFVVFAVPAFAADAIEREKLAAPGVAVEEAPASVEDQALMLCQAVGVMAEYNVDGPDYKAGVDAYGHSVVPADGGAPQQFTVPDRVDIPLNIDVLNTMGVTTTPTPALSTNVGTVSILKNGTVLFNDADNTTKINEYCKKHLKTEGMK